MIQKQTPLSEVVLVGSEDRRQELKDQLEAGNEWMRMNGLEPSKTSPGDIEIAADYPHDGWDSQDQATLEYLQSGNAYGRWSKNRKRY